MSKCGLVKDRSERERGRESKVSGFQEDEKYSVLGELPPGSLTKQERHLQGNEIFIANKKGMKALLKKLGRSHKLWQERWKM